MTFCKRFLKGESGQGLAEYVLVVFLTVLATAGFYLLWTGPLSKVAAILAERLSKTR